MAYRLEANLSSGFHNSLVNTFLQVLMKLMKINSHCWLRTALQRLQCIFIILWKYSNKRRTAAAALIRGRRLLTFPPHVRHLIEGGAYSGAALIRVNTVI